MQVKWRYLTKNDRETFWIFVQYVFGKSKASASFVRRKLQFFNTFGTGPRSTIRIFSEEKNYYSKQWVKEITQNFFEAGKTIDYVSNTLHMPRSTVGSLKTRIEQRDSIENIPQKRKRLQQGTTES